MLIYLKFLLKGHSTNNYWTVKIKKISYSFEQSYSEVHKSDFVIGSSGLGVEGIPGLNLIS